MATIDLITYDQKMVTPKDDALIHQFGISNGVLYGCEVTLANSNTLHITGGQGVIYGRQWEIAEGDITVTLPASGSLKGRLYVKIDLSNTTNPIELLVQTAVTLPDLTDDDQINVDNSVSELELCTFDVSSLTISNLERTVEQVANGDHQDVVDLQADVSEIKSNLTDLLNETNFDQTYTIADGSRAKVSAGTIGRWGKLIIVDIKIQILTTLNANDYWQLLSGFPSPSFSKSLNCSRLGSKGGSCTIDITSGGVLFLRNGSVAFASGDEISVTSFYWIP